MIKIKLQIIFFNLGFNSYQQSGKLSRPIQEKILEKSKNQFQIFFLNDHPYWKGTILQLSGSNASRFYFLAKRNKIDWQILEKATLSRFDINYCRENKRDKISSSDFIENCYTKLKRTNYKVQLEKNRKGSILRIGNRKANHYGRIYQQNNSLKFEYEMKGRFLQKFHKLLVSNNFEEIESKLTKQFLFYFGKLLPLQHSYLDWLVLQLRPIRKQKTFQLGLQSDYIKSESSINSETLIQFIQFLNYAQNLDYTIQNLDEISYRKVTFIIRDFITYQNPTISSKNRYQFQKTKDFFQRLQTGVLITSFTNNTFQSLIGIPRVTFERSLKLKYLICNVWLLDDLFYYQYPFYIPNFFHQKLSKDQFRVRFKFYQIFSSINIEKEFFVQLFLDSYPVKISNQQKKIIKQEFVELIHLMQDFKLIDNHYKIMSNGHYYSTDRLDVDNISEGFVLYEKFNLD